MRDGTESSAKAATAPDGELPEQSCRTKPDFSEQERQALELWSDLLRVTSTVQARVSEDLIGGAGITPEEVELLMRLLRAPQERLRMVEIGRSLLLSNAGVTRLVDRLEQRGLVERASCSHDRRVVYATLTQHGRDAFAEAGPLLAAAAVKHLGRHLDAQEIATMRRGLLAILAAEGEAPAT
jgi:DNA-binding MarR family transcriptional regulator